MVLVGVLCGCSSSSSGGVPFSVQDQIFFGASGDYELKMLDYSGACALQQASDTHKQNTQYIELHYYGSNIPGPGTYGVGATVKIALHKRDGACNLTESVATSGSVTITNVTSSTLTGSFTANLPGYGTVSGNLDASFCDTSSSTGPQQCVP